MLRNSLLKNVFKGKPTLYYYHLLSEQSGVKNTCWLLLDMSALRSSGLWKIIRISVSVWTQLAIMLKFVRMETLSQLSLVTNAIIECVLFIKSLGMKARLVASMKNRVQLWLDVPRRRHRRTCSLGFQRNAQTRNAVLLSANVEDATIWLVSSPAITILSRILKLNRS